MALRLSTRRWGDGGRSVLLLHGITSNAAGWWRLAADLADEGWCVTAADLRGHGDSPRADEYSLAGYAADVLAMYGDWDAVLGHSLGGSVAVLAADADPGFTSRLVLQDPALMLGTSDLEEAVGWLIEPYERPQTAEAVLAANPTWDRADAAIKAEALGQCSPEVVRATVMDNPDWNLIAETRRLGVPTTILGGDPHHGGIFPITIGEWFADASPFIDYVLLTGSGHSAHREPEAYDAYLAAVLAALEGRP